MNIRKVLLSVVAIAAIASTSVVVAQDKKGGGTAAQVTRIDEAVSLKADQKAKVEAILNKASAAVAALPQDERQAKGREIRANANKEIRALLTPEQQKKFDAMPPATGGKKKN